MYDVSLFIFINIVLTNRGDCKTKKVKPIALSHANLPLLLNIGLQPSILNKCFSNGTKWQPHNVFLGTQLTHNKQRFLLFNKKLIGI